MQIQELISKLEGDGLCLEPDGELLHVSPPSAITEEHAKLIRSNKKQLLELLHRRDVGSLARHDFKPQPVSCHDCTYWTGMTPCEAVLYTSGNHRGWPVRFCGFYVSKDLKQ